MIGVRILQAVHVVHPDALDDATRGERAHEGMCFCENPGSFHADPQQAADVKEAPVVGFMSCGLPAGQAVGLLFQKHVQPVITGGIAGGSVQDHRDVPGIPVLQLREGLGKRFGMEGKGRLMIAKDKFAFPDLQFEVTLFQHASVRPAEYGQKNLSVEPFLAWTPVDVKEVGIHGGRAVLQDVAPPWIVFGIGRHMIRYDVHNAGDAGVLQGIRELLEPRPPAQVGVEGARVTHIIPVPAAGDGGGHGAEVDGICPQPFQIGNRARGIGEGEGGGQLEPVCRSVPHHARSQS